MGLLIAGLSTAVSRARQTEWTGQCTVCMNDYIAWKPGVTVVSHCCCSYRISYLHRYNRLTGSPHTPPGTTGGHHLVAA